MQSVRNSPRIRGARNPLARLISWISSRISRRIAGQPPWERDYQRHKALTPPMPVDHRFRPDDCDSVHHARAEAIEPDKRHRIRIGQPQTPNAPSAQYVHLTAEYQILSFEPPMQFRQRRQPTK